MNERKTIIHQNMGYSKLSQFFNQKKSKNPCCLNITAFLLLFYTSYRSYKIIHVFDESQYDGVKNYNNNLKFFEWISFLPYYDFNLIRALMIIAISERALTESEVKNVTQKNNETLSTVLLEIQTKKNLLINDYSAPVTLEKTLLWGMIDHKVEVDCNFFLSIHLSNFCQS